MMDFLRYWRASIADGFVAGPADREVDGALSVAVDDVARGVLSAEVNSRLWAGVDSKQTGGAGAADSVSVAVITHLAVAPSVHAVCLSHLGRVRFPLVMLFATVNRAGMLTPGGRAFVPREFVAPSVSPVSFTSMSDLDAFYSAHPEVPADWTSAVDFAGELYSFLAFPSNPFGLVLDSMPRVLVANSSGSAKAIVGLYDFLIGQPQPVPSALSALFKPISNKTVPDVFDVDAQCSHVGQMGGKFGLSPSQRSALLAFLSGQGQVLAVNGAPGTGKTTLLQSVVASLWTQAAVDRAPCPIIVGTSTNNQAVENIVSAFLRAEVNSDDTEAVRLAGRWLPAVDGFGMNMPSDSAKKKAARNGLRLQLYEKHPSTQNKAVHFASCFDDLAVLQSTADSFLEQFFLRENIPLPPGLVGVDAKVASARNLFNRPLQTTLSKHENNVVFARDVLHGFLVNELNSMRELLTVAHFLAHGDAIISPEAVKTKIAMLNASLTTFSLEIRFLEQKTDRLRGVLNAFVGHRAIEPFSVKILAAAGLSAKRVERDRLFLANFASSYDLLELSDLSSPSLSAVEAVVSRALGKISSKMEMFSSKVRSLQMERDALQKALETFGRYYNLMDSVNLPDLYAFLDTTFRHRAFLRTVHYWEAEFLLASFEVALGRRRENKDPANLVSHFRRLAMLCPCFVSSLHKLPDWFSGFKQGAVPLVGMINLLIVDEGGQVAPEIGAASLALAQRALVVGDAHQIEPVWNSTESMDELTAGRFKLLNAHYPYDLFVESGASAARGSLIRLAQGASHYVSHPQIARGMSLVEHRRCAPDIINYCNELVYGGALEVLTARGRPRVNSLPAMGFAHVLGREVQSGGSRANEIEAESIACWLAGRKEELLQSFGVGSLKNLVGIVTPFAAQAAVISRKLAEHGLGADGITVGTAHALQGAEREIVMFSPVYSVKRKGLFFDQSPNLLNVAVSRAKEHFLLFGNMEALADDADVPSGLLARMLKAQPENEIVDVVPILPKSIPMELVESLTTLDKHRNALRRVIRNAHKEVVVVSPYLTAKALEADDVCNEFRTACKRGATVKVVVDVACNVLRDGQQEFDQCVKAMTDAGAKVFLIPPKANGFAALHSKLLWADDDVFVSGSFNWLSSPRYDKGAKLEHSSLVNGANVCASMIKDARKTLSESTAMVGFE